jgi:hypothetical protein
VHHTRLRPYTTDRVPVRAFAPRRSVRTGLVVVGIVLLVAAVATWWLAPFRSSDRLAYLGPDPAGLVGWSLASDGGGSALRPDAAQDATVVLVRAAWWPACAPWDEGGDAWLTTEIAYLPWSVTVTLRRSDAFASAKSCNAFYDYWGQPVEVRLSEPLGSRPLFDGSTFPSTAKPYR